MKTEINFLKGHLKSCRHFKDSSVHSEKGTRGGKKLFSLLTLVVANFTVAVSKPTLTTFT